MLSFLFLLSTLALASLAAAGHDGPEQTARPTKAHIKRSPITAREQNATPSPTITSTLTLSSTLYRGDSYVGYIENALGSLTAMPAPTAFATPNYTLENYFDSTGALAPLMSFVWNQTSQDQAFFNFSSPSIFEVTNEILSFKILRNGYIVINSDWAYVKSTTALSGITISKRASLEARDDLNGWQNRQRVRRVTQPHTVPIQLDFTPLGEDGSDPYPYFSGSKPTLTCYQLQCLSSHTVGFNESTIKQHAMRNAGGNGFEASCSYIANQDPTACPGAYNGLSKGLPSEMCQIYSALSGITFDKTLIGESSSISNMAAPFVADALLMGTLYAKIGCAIKTAFSKAPASIKPDLNAEAIVVNYNACSIGREHQTVTTIESATPTIKATQTVFYAAGDPTC